MVDVATDDEYGSHFSNRTSETCKQCGYQARARFEEQRWDGAQRTYTDAFQEFTVFEV